MLLGADFVEPQRLPFAHLRQRAGLGAAFRVLVIFRGGLINGQVALEFFD